MAWDDREEADFDMDLPFDEEPDEREDDFGEEDDELDRLDRSPMDHEDTDFDDFATDTPIGLAYGGYEAPDFEDF